MLTVSPSFDSEVRREFPDWHYYQLSVLYVSKTVYAEAIEVYYERNAFWFDNAYCVVSFVTQTLARKNGRALLNRIRSICLEIELWHEDLEGTSVEGEYYIGWRDLFADPEYRLPKLFPGLERLLLEFNHSESRFRTKWTPTRSVDEGNETFFELWDLMAENPLWELSVDVLGPNEENTWHMARDIMGLEYEEYVEPVDETPEVDIDWETRLLLHNSQPVWWEQRKRKAFNT